MKHLFFPWLRYLIINAYNDYVLTNSYQRKIDYFGREITVSKWIETQILDDMILVFKKNPIKAIFWPVGAIMHPDLEEYFLNKNKIDNDSE
jgi:hypothetical protein